MRKFILIAAGMWLTILPGWGAAPIKFGGTWQLNREKSEGLTGGLAGAEIMLVVTQDEKRIHVEQKVRIRGREQPSQELIWNLDGSPSTAEVVRPMAGTTNLKARWNEAAKSLELTSTITGEDQGKSVTVTTKEVWELLNSGKSLQVTRMRTAPQLRQRSKLYFDRAE